MQLVSFDLPSVFGDQGVWGPKVNAILGLLKDTLNTLITVQVAQGASGFVFYDPTNGWPADTPTNAPFVFVSIGSPSAPEPVGGSDDSVWMYQL